MPVKAVLFDLDDTLYDHQYGARSGLVAVREQYACFQQIPFEQLEIDNQTLLDALHGAVLKGELSVADARRERFRRLLVQYGGPDDGEAAHDATEAYRSAYLAAERCIPGAVDLIHMLKDAGIRIGVVTNSTTAEQIPKIARMGISNCIDVLVVSEAAGAVKPDPAIFNIALDQLDCAPDEVVMMGDNWSADIQGARSAGIRAVWINRYGRTCPDPTHAAEINALEPVEQVYQILMNGHN